MNEIMGTLKICVEEKLKEAESGKCERIDSMHEEERLKFEGDTIEK